MAIAVFNIDEACQRYEEVTGVEASGFEEVEEQGVRIAMIQLEGGSIELIAPMNDSSPIAGFLEKRGEGIHHIALKTNDVSRDLSDLKEKKIRLIDKEPRAGREGSSVAFIHPKALNGVLVELTEPEEQGI